MLLRIFSVVVIYLCFSASVVANTHAAYEQERARVLALDPSQRQQAISSGMAFDKHSVLGKYFYNTVVAQTPGSLSRFSISESDLRDLKRSSPRYHLEYQILSHRTSLQPLPDILSALVRLAAQAKQQQWPRLFRLATAQQVAAELAMGLHYKAIVHIRNVIDDASEVALNAHFDYPLTAIYSDLADAYRLGGNDQKSHFYCNKLLQTARLSGDSEAQGKLCRSRTLLSEGNNSEALRLASEVLNQARANDVLPVMSFASLVIASAYAAMEKPLLARRFALEGLEFSHDAPALSDTARGNLLALLTTLAINDNNSVLASEYLAALKTQTLPARPGQLSATVLRLERDVALLNNDPGRALGVSQRLNAWLQGSINKQLSHITVAGVDAPLHEQQIAFADNRQRLETSRSRVMTMVALFTTTISIVCGVAVYRLYRQKTTIESFTRIDQLTSVENRWFAMKSINQILMHMDRSGDKACVALLDVDHFKRINERFGYETGDKVLAQIAKVFKYQLRREDVIGRYGGEEFILCLVGTGLQDGLNKMDELRTALGSQMIHELADEEPLRFSCGLVEVSSSARPDDVIALCDALLSNAKQRGRNQTCAREFNSITKQHCA